MSDNSWYEKGELPPVGTVCEITHNGHSGCWRKIEILKYCLDDDGDSESQRMIVIDLSGYSDFVVGNPYIVYGIKDNDFLFRPIKTERELAIDDLKKTVVYSSESILSLSGTAAKQIATALYDAGYRKNES